jgi:hypothetical protein
LDEARPQPGPLMPIVWWAVLMVVGVCLCLWVAVASMGSESAGVQAAMIACLPLGFLFGGAIGSIPVHLLVRGSTAGRVLAPAGCGCLSAVFLACVVAFFFAVVFPAL